MCFYVFMYSSVCKLCFHIWLYTWRSFCSFTNSIYSVGYIYFFFSIIAGFSFLAIAKISQWEGWTLYCSIGHQDSIWDLLNSIFQAMRPFFQWLWVYSISSLPLRFGFHWSVPCSQVIFFFLLFRLIFTLECYIPQRQSKLSAVLFAVSLQFHKWCIL